VAEFAMNPYVEKIMEARILTRLPSKRSKYLVQHGWLIGGRNPQINPVARVPVSRDLRLKIIKIVASFS